MPISIPHLVKEAMKASCVAFTELIKEARDTICKEEGSVGRLNIIGRLAKISPLGEAVIIGDLHGDLESLIDILEESRLPHKLGQNADAVAVFLGDYGDRGVYSAEVYYTILSLKLRFPEQMVLMRGNHEGPEDLLADPHDLPEQFRARFGEEWTDAYAEIRELFACMYNAVLVDGHYVLVHGGLPWQARTLDDLAEANVMHPRQRFLEDILWSDPSEAIENTCESPRGAGRLFGEKATKEMLRLYNAEVLIRGHEPCQDGFKVDHGGKVLTLFSRKGPPYFNVHGAYLDVELSRRLENATLLTPYIHKF